MTTSRSVFLFLFLILGCLPTILIYLTPIDDQFIIDYYAKRLMVLFSFPVIFFFLLSLLIQPRGKVISEEFRKLFFLYSLVLIYSILIFFLSEKLIFGFFVTDLYQFLIPIIVCSLVSFASDQWVYRAFFAVGLLSFFGVLAFGVKLQYSYLGASFALTYLMISIRERRFNLILVLFSLIVIYRSLLGKSIVICFILVLFIVLFSWKKHLLKPKTFLFIFIGFSLFSSVLVLNWELVINTESWKHFEIAQRHASGGELDVSTLNRVFEGEKVLEKLNKSSLSILFGTGLGTFIDMSDTTDSSVLRVQTDPEHTRNIHLLFFMIALRFGLIGLIAFYYFFFLISLRAIYVIKNITIEKKDKRTFFIAVGSCIYVIMIVIDGQVTGAHMISNYFFWFCAFNVIVYHNKMHCKSVIN